MNIIGISGFHNSVGFKKREWPKLTSRQYRIAQGFDGAAGLVTDEGLVAAAEEERFTHKKATGAFPIRSMQFCLRDANLQLADIDYIAHGFSYDKYKSYFSEDPYTARQFDEVYSREAMGRLFAEFLPDFSFENKFVQVPHHLAHAASAHYMSGYNESLICITDGMGEMESMTVAVGRGSEIEILTQIPALHSLGILYGVFTLYLGFYMNLDEYKVMGLAPYGNSRRYFSQIMDMVQLKKNGTYDVGVFTRNKTFEEKETHEGVISYLTELFGPAQEPESEITQEHMDIAASLQAVLQTCLMHSLTHFAKHTKMKNLCMAGGVALNCTSNGVIKRSGLFRNVFTQPAAGDDGVSIGAALYVQYQQQPNRPIERLSMPYWGPDLNEDELDREIAGRDDIRATRYDSFSELTQHVAGCLAEGQIVSWFQGRMEFGPRALGNRSILADPRAGDMRDRINALVKKREAFRPFAPAVLAESASELFDIEAGDDETYAHMLYVIPVREEYREQLPAITHIDGSARIQTVTREGNERFWEILNEFGKITGVPCLLNTSFNVRGQPIVCYPNEGIDTFLFANLDILVIGNYLVTPKSKAGLQEDV